LAQASKPSDRSSPLALSSPHMMNGHWRMSSLHCWLLALEWFGGGAAACSIDPAIYVRLFENNMPMFQEIARLVQEAGAESVLDLGTGPGEPSTLIAKAMPKTKVIATDVQPVMIEKAKVRAHGLPNVEFGVASADDLSGYGSASVDAVTMCYVLMFVPDRARSLREVARVLKPRGRAYIAVWKRLGFMEVIQQALEALTGSAPPTPAVNPMALSGERAVEELVAATPGVTVKFETMLTYSFKLGDAASACDSAMIIAGPAISKLVADGKANAKEEYCKILIELLETSGGMSASGEYEVLENTAQLLVMEKARTQSEL